MNVYTLVSYSGHGEFFGGFTSIKKLIAYLKSFGVEHNNLCFQTHSMKHDQWLGVGLLKQNQHCEINLLRPFHDGIDIESCTYQVKVAKLNPPIDEEQYDEDKENEERELLDFQTLKYPKNTPIKSL